MDELTTKVDNIRQKPPRKDKIIAHFKRNKWRYITVAVFVGGALVGYYVKSRPIIQNIISNTEGPVTIGNNNIVQTLLQRRGHPGNVVRCVETGEIFASQKRCADLLGLNPSDLSLHLRGKKEIVKDLHFEILGEAH